MAKPPVFDGGDGDRPGLAATLMLGSLVTLSLQDSLIRLGGAETSFWQFQTLRSEYMNPFIRPGSASLAIGVMVDGLLAGVFAFSTAPSPGAMADPSRIYMLSDFPVAPTDYPRLSKLVLYAALSRESQLLAERAARRRIRHVYTTAFSNRPASMKYRGLFSLHNRVENPTARAAWGQHIDAEHDPYYSQKYELNYIAPIGAWDLAGGLALWVRKHGMRERDGNARDPD